MRQNPLIEPIGILRTPIRCPQRTYIGVLTEPIGVLTEPISGILDGFIGVLREPYLYLPWVRVFSYLLLYGFILEERKGLTVACDQSQRHGSNGHKFFKS